MIIIIQVVWCHSGQNGILLLLVRNCAITCFLQATCNEFSHMFAFEVGALQIAEEFLTGGFACEKHVPDIRAQVLVRLKTS